MNNSTISIIIVTYNSEEEIIGCLDSLFQSEDVDILVYAIDNCSQDSTVTLLKNYAEKDARVRVTLNQQNIGLAAANNTPLPYLNTEYTLVLNPDILVRPDSIKKLVKRLKSDDKVGMIGPLCLFGDGTPHKSAVSQHNIFSIIAWRFIPHSLMRFLFDRTLTLKEKEVLFVSGACYLMPTNLYRKIGGYDPIFFLTVSDAADVGVRLRQHGYSALFYPESIITHFSGRSNAPLKLLTQYWGITGDLHFLHKHNGRIAYLLAKWILAGGSFARYVAFEMVFLFTRSGKIQEKARLYKKLSTALLDFNPTVPVRTSIN